MAAVAANQDIKSDLVPKIASAFCSGVAETGGTCGALNGGILGLSMVHGRSSNEDNREFLYQKTKALVKDFQNKFEHLNCPDLLQLQLGTPEASAEYGKRQLSLQCEQYIRFVTQVVVEMLQEA